MTPLEQIKVFIRVRPLINKEQDLNCTNCLEIKSDKKTVEITSPSEGTKQFQFQYCFSEYDGQSLVYEKVCFPLVENVLENKQTTIFAYGQTCCGKTYSMMGSEIKEEHKG